MPYGVAEQSRAEQTWRKKKRSALLEAPLEVLP
jgi:hypothetical protein